MRGVGVLLVFEYTATVTEVVAASAGQRIAQLLVLGHAHCSRSESGGCARRGGGSGVGRPLGDVVDSKRRIFRQTACVGSAELDRTRVAVYGQCSTRLIHAVTFSSNVCVQQPL